MNKQAGQTPLPRIDVFVSYRRIPSAMLAQLLAEKLPQRGIRHVFVDTRVTDGAGPFPDRLLRAIEACKVFVCLLADTTLDSEWVRTEIEHAYHLGKPMIPVFQESYIPPKEALTPSLAALLQDEGIHVLDIRNIYLEQTMNELATMLKRTRAHARPARALPMRLVRVALLAVVALAIGGLLVSQLGPPAATPSISTTVATISENTTPAETATGLSVPVVTTNSQWKPQFQDFNGVEMALVPPGCFMMGSTEADIAALNQQYSTSGFSDQGPQSHVCFDEPFWIDKTDVTQAQFKQFGGQAAHGPAFTGDRRPVERITWFEARDFCVERGARLPTEAEWEYAARGPDDPVYPWGNTFDGGKAVYNRNPSQGTAEVGSLPAGASWVGALDMSGNVWQWVSTLYKSYPYDAEDGREDAKDTSTERMLRGGSWDLNNQYLWTAYRYEFDPAHEDNHLGVRCARSFR